MNQIELILCVRAFTFLQNIYLKNSFVVCNFYPSCDDSSQHIFGTFLIEVRIFHELL